MRRSRAGTAQVCILPDRPAEAEQLVLLTERTVHGSRFDGPTGKCVMGPSNRGLNAENERAKKAQK